MGKAAATTKKQSNLTNQATKTYVLDTSVLLSDPRALFKFKEQEVVIPIIVINELERNATTQKSAITLARLFGY